MAGINIGVGVTGLEQLQKAVTLLEKSGKVGDNVVAAFKGAQTSLQQFNNQVQKMAAAAELASISLKQLVLNTERLSASEMALVRARLKREAVDNMIVAQAGRLLKIEAELIFLQSAERAALLETLAAKNATLAVNRLLAGSQEFLLGVTARLTTSYGALSAAQIALLRTQEANRAVALGLASAYTAQTTSVAASTGAFSLFGSVVRGVAGALGMLWFAYGQLLPLMAAFAAAMSVMKGIGQAVDFEYITQNIYSINEASERSKISLGDLRKELLHLKEINGAFAELRHTPLELAEGMEELARSGVGMVAALRELPELSRMASLGNMDLAKAVKSTIGGVNAFRKAQADSYYEMKQGITVYDATIKATLTFGDVANMMAKAADISSTEIEELSGAFSHAASTGVIAGLRFDEAAAALAALSNAGIRGTQAATAFQTGMLKLMNPTPKLTKMLEGLNLQFSAFRKDGSAKNLVELLNDLHDIGSKLSEKKFGELMSNLFTIKSIKSSILAMSPKAIEEMALKIRMAAGEVSYLETRFAELKGTAKVAASLLRVEFMAVLTEVFTSDSWSSGLYAMLDALKALRPAIVGTAGVIGDFFEGIKYGSVVLLPLLATGLWNVGKAAFFMAPGMTAAATSTYALSTAFLTLKGSMLMLASAAAGWAIGTWLREEYQAVDQLGIALVAGFEKVLAAVQEFGGAIIDQIKLSFDGLIKLFKVSVGSLITEVGSLLERLWNWMAESVEKNSGVLKFIGVDAAEMAGNFRAAASATAGSMKAFGASLTGGKTIAGAFNEVVTSLTDNVKNHYESYESRAKVIDDIALSMTQESIAAHNASAVAEEKAKANKGLAGSYGEVGLALEALQGAEGRAGNRESSGVDLSDSERGFLDKQLPMRKAREEYEKGVAQIKALQEKLKGTAEELSTTDVSTMMHNLEASTIGAGKAFKGSAEKIADFNAKIKEAFGDTSQAYLSDYEKLQEKISDAYTKLKGDAEKEFGIGTPETAARMATVNAEMEKAYKSAEALESASLDEFSSQMKEAFGDASTGKLSAYDKMMEKIDDTITKFENGMKDKFDGDDSGLARMRRELGLLKTEAQQTAEELRKADLGKTIDEIDEAFGRQSQKYMSDYDKELARINKTYDDRYDIIDKTYPLEQASNQTLEDRATALAALDAHYASLIKNSDILIKKSNNLWAGFSLGVRDAIRETKTLGELGYDVALTLRDAFHDTFVSVLKGDFESIGDLWDKLLDRMLDMFIDWIASLIARWAMAAIGEMIGAAFSGAGYGGIGGAISAAFGGGGGGGGYVGAAASVGSSGYSAYTGTTPLAALGTAAYNYLYPQTVIAPYGGAPTNNLGIYQGRSINSPYSTPSAPAAGSSMAGQASPGTYGVLASQASVIPAGSTAIGWTYGMTPTVASQVAQSGSYGVLASQAGSQAATPAASTAGAGLSTYLPIIGTVIAIASNLYSWQKRKMAPTEADMFNKAGFRPETFSGLIGDQFQAALIPFLGQTTAKWDKSASALVMLADAEKVREARQLTENGWAAPPVDQATGAMSWDANSPTWKNGNIDVEKALALLRDGGLGKVLAGGTLPKTLDEYSSALTRMGVSLDQSTIDRMWEWGQATKTSGEFLKESISTLNLGGGELNKLKKLITDAKTTLNGSTRAISDYLTDLGYSAEQVQKVLAGVGSSRLQKEIEAIEERFAGQPDIMKQWAYQALEMQVLEEAATGTTRALAGLSGRLSEGDDTLGVLGAISDLDSLKNSITQVGSAAAGVDDLGDSVESLPEALLAAASAVKNFAGAVADLPGISVSGQVVTTGDSFAGGGLLQGGTGTKDDLYLGTVNGRTQLAMGGEYIVNPESTRKHLRLLEGINADRYETGGPVPSNTRVPTGRSLNEQKENLQNLVDLMADVADEMFRMKQSDFANDLLTVRQEMQKTYDEAKKLGASEQDLADIRKYEQAQITQLYVERKKAQDDFMRGINDEISGFGLTELEKALRSNRQEMWENIAQAKELGLGEVELAKIRELALMKALDLREQQRKAQGEYMQDINDQIAMFGMTDQQKGILENQRAMEAALESAKELGLGESDLAKIRTLYGLKATEVMNAGLKESLDTMKSFKESLAGVEDEAAKSATAQKDLLGILAQARSGDFSGVEKIGDVLKNISIDKSKYATAADYARDYWKTMGAVSEIERLTESRLGSAAPTPTDAGAIAGMQSIANRAVTNASTTSAASASVAAASEDTAKVVAAVNSLRESVVAGNVQVTKNTNKMAKMLDKWEAIGLPVNSSYNYTEAAGVGSGTITRAA